MRFDDGEAVFVRQLFQGKLHGDIAVAGEAPHFASVQSGAYRADAVAEGDAPAPIRSMDLSLDPSTIRTASEAPYQDAKDAVDLGSADIIVSVGRGIQDPDNIPQAEALARAIGGELAASRPICDNGWLPLDRQIGSSGQTVAPNLYLALGDLGGDPACGRHEGREDDRRREQGSRGTHLRDCRLRDRGGSVRGHAGSRQGSRIG